MTDTDPREPLMALRAEVGKAVVGQDAAITGLVIALLCRGHVLLEGVPGTAKTLMVRALAASLSLDSKRVQFTPDLMPGDVTGSLVYDNRTSAFSFRPGPVFTNLLLADEINRTPPKTQASLLEVMEEGQVTVDGIAAAAARPVPGGRHPEPDRVRGHLPAARGAARPVPADALGPAARARRRVRRAGPAHGGLRPARPRGRGRAPGRHRRRPGPGPGGRGHGRGLPRGHGLRRRPRARDPHLPVGPAGRLPPRRHRPAAHGTGVGVAGRPRLRDPR